MNLKQIHLHLSTELVDAIDAARGDLSRAAWVEKVLWRNRSVRAAAEAEGISDPQLPSVRVGKYDRTRRFKVTLRYSECIANVSTMIVSATSPARAIQVAERNSPGATATDAKEMTGGDA